MVTIDNFRISAKIGLIVAILAIVSLGTVGFAALRMKGIGDVYSDLIARVDASTTQAVRAGSYAEAYISSIYQLAAETTDDGSNRLLAQVNDDREHYEAIMMKIGHDLPEKADLLAPLIDKFKKTSTACDRVVLFAASTNATDDPLKSLKAAKSECDPLARDALQDSAKMVDDLLAYAARRSEELSRQRHATIFAVLTSEGAGLFLALVVALWIGSKGLSQPIVRLKSVMDVVTMVSSSAATLQITAQSMSSTASQASRQAKAAAATVEQATENVQTVASAAEELSSSIQEISRQVTESDRISMAASEETARANAMVQGLAAAADRIGEVVMLIDDIAAQTNLLALNATIEAAHAGEAGKGFAVVAGEVKNLANQTGRATQEIGQQIAAVQEETRRTVEAIKGIGAVIDQVRQIASGIASAVEEQGAATREIARGVQHAAERNQDVSHDIGGVTQSASTTGVAAETVLVSACDLASHSKKLRADVADFLAEVRAS